MKRILVVMKSFLAFICGILILSSCATVLDRLTVRDTDLKPRILFHGSSNRNINIIKPRATGIRDKKEGPVVFAAIDIGLASIFMTQVYQYGKSGKFCSTCPYYFVYADKDEYSKIDKGGAIYFLPIDSFYTIPNKGLGVNEWISTANVKPLYKLEFESSLNAMLNFGVQVYFVTQEVFKAIDQSEDGGKSILLASESENQKLNKNYFHPTNSIPTDSTQ